MVNKWQVELEVISTSDSAVSEGCSPQSLGWPSAKELQLFKARLKAALKLNQRNEGTGREITVGCRELSGTG